MSELGRFLIIAGGLTLFVGIIFLYGDIIGIGRLLGDIKIGFIGRNGFIIPVTTIVLLSILVTFAVNFFNS
jgi:hypothetical protein